MPRSPSPAAATGLPESTLSRRAMLGRIPAAAIATTTLLPATAEALLNPDGDLLSLYAEFETVVAELVPMQREKNTAVARFWVASANCGLPLGGDEWNAFAKKSLEHVWHSTDHLEGRLNELAARARATRACIVAGDPAKARIVSIA